MSSACINESASLHLHKLKLALYTIYPPTVLNSVGLSRNFPCIQIVSSTRNYGWSDLLPTDCILPAERRRQKERAVAWDTDYYKVNAHWAPMHPTSPYWPPVYPYDSHWPPWYPSTPNCLPQYSSAPMTTIVPFLTTMVPLRPLITSNNPLWPPGCST